MNLWDMVVRIFKPVPSEIVLEARKDVTPIGSTVKFVGYATDYTSRSQFIYPEDFDFDEIETAYNTDSYLRQAIDKIVDLIFKAGYTITGKNQQAVDYINMRLRIMAIATGIPTKQFFVNIAEDLVLFHNVFIVKARQSGDYQYPSGLRVTGINGGKPIVGYFVLPVSTIAIKKTETGVITGYQQSAPSVGKSLVFKPEDIIHIYADKPRGKTYGVPFVWQALDDIKLLRQVEELVARLIYKNIFPLIHYKVGNTQAGQGGTPGEIEEAAQNLHSMPIDGALVTNERHQIEIVGSEGKALDAYNYLKYYEERVFTALGVSETLMGRGSTANKSTADNLTAQANDRIKAYQSIMESFVDDSIITELLYEGGFDPIAKPEDMVYFRFKETDIDNRTKLENQALQKWLSNAITFEEMRTEIGMDVAAQEDRLYVNMIGSANAENKAAIANLVSPQNQHTTKHSLETLHEYERTQLQLGAIASEYKGILLKTWNDTQADITDLIRQRYMNGKKDYRSFSPSEINLVCMLSTSIINARYEALIGPVVKMGIQDAQDQSGKTSTMNAGSIMMVSKHEHENLLRNLFSGDITTHLAKVIRDATDENITSLIMGAFKSLEYKLDLLAIYDVYHTYNYAFGRTAVSMKLKKAFVNTSNESCETCQRVSSVPLTLNLTGIPPLHYGCKCILTLNDPNKEGEQ